MAPIYELSGLNGMVTIDSLCGFLEQFAPNRLAESWDNVGLLVGDRAWPVQRVMTCLTVTHQSVDEAAAERASLIVTHHPLPFHPLRRITSDTLVGQLLLKLAEHRIGVLSPHTSFDSAAQGINQQLAEGLGLRDIAPLVPLAEDGEPLLGAGRWGPLERPHTLAELARTVQKFLQIDGLQMVGTRDHPIRTVAVACGSAGQFLDAARRAGCDALLTGETNFHTCLEAQGWSMALLLPGHYATERFAIDLLADRLAAEFPELRVWASRGERDPLTWFSSTREH